MSALYTYNNKLYAGGWFQKAGSLNTSHIANWNGLNWGNLGTGVDWRTLMFIKYSSELYIGGMFGDAGGVSNTKAIARWDGVNWNDVGMGVTGTGNIYAIGVYQNELYAGGTFNAIGGMNINSISRWNGSNWMDMGGSTGFPKAMAVYKNELYVGGQFSTINGVTLNSIGRWDGIQWRQVGLGLDGVVNTMLADPQNDVLYVGGGFYNAFNADSTQVKTTVVGKWDGNEWSSLGDDTITGAYSMALYHGELYVGGTNLPVTLKGIARWDGRQWNPLGTGVNGVVLSLAVWNNSLYVGGQFTVAGNDSAFYIAKWTTPDVPTCLKYSTAISTSADTVDLLSGASIQFSDSTDMATDSLSWDFGDNSIDTVKNPVHIYDSVGTYTVTLVTHCACFSNTATQVITVLDSLVGINPLPIPNSILKVYPNPTEGGFIVEIDRSIYKRSQQKTVLKIYDIKGLLVEELAVDKNRLRLRIEASDWTRGVYFCSLEVGGKELQRKKIVIQ